MRIGGFGRLTWGGGGFSVKSCYGHFDTSNQLVGPWRDVWNGVIPPKIQFFMWMAVLGKLSTMTCCGKKTLLCLVATCHVTKMWSKSTISLSTALLLGRFGSGLQEISEQLLLFL